MTGILGTQPVCHRIWSEDSGDKHGVVQESSFLVFTCNIRITVTRGEVLGYWAGGVVTGSEVLAQKCCRIQREVLQEY